MKIIRNLLLLWLIPLFAFGAYPNPVVQPTKKTLNYIILNNADDVYRRTNQGIIYNDVIKEQARQLFGKDYNVKFIESQINNPPPEQRTIAAVSTENTEAYGRQLRDILRQTEPGAKNIVRLNAHAGEMQKVTDDMTAMGYYGPTSMSEGPNFDDPSSLGVFAFRKNILDRTYLEFQEANIDDGTIIEGGCHSNLCKNLSDKYFRDRDGFNIISQDSDLRSFQKERDFFDKLIKEGHNVTQLTNQELQGLSDKYRADMMFQGDPNAKPFASVSNKPKWNPQNPNPGAAMGGDDVFGGGQLSQAEAEQCVLVAKGMHSSAATGRMFGEKGVAARNDQRPLTSESPYYPPGSPLGFYELPSTSAPRKFPREQSAPDAAGKDSNERESEINYQYRMRGVAEKDKGLGGITVTSEKDFGLLYPKIREQLNLNGDAIAVGLSNEAFALWLAAKGAEPILPSDEDHRDLSRPSFVPPNGSHQEMMPGVYPKNNTAKSVKVLHSKAPADTKVTDDCKFEPLTKEEMEQMPLSGAPKQNTPGNTEGSVGFFGNINRALQTTLGGTLGQVATSGVPNLLLNTMMRSVNSLLSQVVVGR